MIYQHTSPHLHLLPYLRMKGCLKVMLVISGFAEQVLVAWCRLKSPQQLCFSPRIYMDEVEIFHYEVFRNVPQLRICYGIQSFSSPALLSWGWHRTFICEHLASQSLMDWSVLREKQQKGA